MAEDFSFEGFNDVDSFNPNDIDDELNSVEEVQVVTENLDYDKYIVIDRKDLTNFVHLVSSLSRQSVDAVGRSIFFDCSAQGVITLKYSNTPFFATMTVSNKSVKTVKDFALSIATVVKLLSQGFSALVIVEDEDGNLNIAVADSLLYLDSINISSDVYAHINHEVTKVLNKEVTSYVFKTLGSALSLTDRTSEKVIVMKDGKAHFTTGAFIAETTTPFDPEDNFIVYRTVADIMATIVDSTSSELRYSIVDDDTLVISDGCSIYIELVVGSGMLIPKFLSPAAGLQLSFDADVQLMNDQILRLTQVVSSLEYFASQAVLEFSGSALKITFEAASSGKKSTFTFRTLSGSFSEGTMKVAIPTLKMILNLLGSADTQYALTDNGLGLQTSNTKLLIRKL